MGGCIAATPIIDCDHQSMQRFADETQGEGNR
jgi:hypothetical protein